MKLVTGKIEFLSKFKDMIAVQRQCCLGVYVEDRTIYVNEVVKQKNNYCIRFCEAINIDSEEELTSELVAERIKHFCLQRAIDTENTAICLPDGTLWWLQMNMPVMPEHEVAEAVKWQIEAKDPFNGRKYWHNYSHASDGMVYAAAISLDDGEELIKNFQEADLQLKGIILYKGKMEELAKAEMIFAPEDTAQVAVEFPERVLQRPEKIAIYTAFAALKPGFMVNVIADRYQLEQIAWKKLSSFVALIGALFLLSSCCYSFLQLRQSQEEFADMQSKLAIAERQEKKMQELQLKYNQLAAKEKILTKLSRERDSSYALLINFGTLKSEGIRLTEISSAEKGSFTCQGKAESYNALVNYLKEINARKQYFQGGALLIESKLGEMGAIDFTIKVILRNL